MITYVKTLPKNVNLGKYRDDKADGYFYIQHFGKAYYFPLTKEAKRLFGIKRVGDKLQFPKGNEYQFADFVRDITASVYLQVRDTVGVEIREELMREIQGRIDKILVPQIDKRVEEKFEEKDKLLAPKNEEIK